MNYFKGILFGLIVIIFGISPSVIYSQSDENPSISTQSAVVNSYTLFWPITAGKTMGDSLYWLKLFKENFRESLIFGSLKKANYSLEISTKRVVESEKLYLSDKDFSNGSKTLSEAHNRWQKALELLDLSREKKVSTDALEDRFLDVLERQKRLLEYILLQVDQNNKKDIEESVLALDKILIKVREYSEE